MTVAFAIGLAPGPWGAAAGVVADYVAMGLHLDGTWKPGPGQELVFAPQALDPAALRGLREDDWLRVFALAHIAADSFAGTKQALGTVGVPTPSPRHWWEPLEGILQPGPRDAVELAHAGRVHVPPMR
jgi:hypothetical protein